MITNYPLNYGDLIILAIIIFCITLYIIFKRQKLSGSTYKGAFYFIFFGISFLLISAMGVCLLEGHWDFNFLFAYLTFRRVSNKSVFVGISYSLFVGYIFLFLGIMQLIFSFIYNFGKENSKKK